MVRVGALGGPARAFGPAVAIVLLQLIVFPVPAGVFVRGIIVGGLTALVAVGMALVYRSDRILNFAQADLGTPSTVLVYVDDNGGATSPGVTADSIKVVAYLAPDNDPIIDFISSAVANDDTNAQFRETTEVFVQMLNEYSQTYGRTVEVEPAGN